MKFKFLELQENYAKILFEDTTPYFVNAIRRTMIADVPKMAIENVTIYDNTSALFDEIIAHRLAMLPIPTYLDEVKGCEDCRIHYTLSKEGECTVYSGDLKAEDPRWNIKDKNIPIVRLLKNQRLILEAEAVLGTGKEHAKWQPVCGIGYKYYPEIEIDQEKCDLCMDCVNSCPRKLIEIKRNKVIVKNPEECTLCMSCVEACGRDAISVKGNPNKIIMQYETDGSLTAKEVFREALNILYEKYDELEKKL